jgi:ADP-ribose pyrophosphatase
MNNTKQQIWKVINSRIIHKTDWLEFKEDECLLPSNKKITYTYARRVDEGPIIIATEQNFIWLVSQYRHPIKKCVWQFPAEGKKPGESWEQAAQRGLQEEIGKRANKLVDLGQYYPDPGSLQQKTHYFLATELINSKKQGDEDDLQKGLFSLKEINQMIDKGEIVDNWTLSGLYLYNRFYAKSA